MVNKTVLYFNYNTLYLSHLINQIINYFQSDNITKKSFFKHRYSLLKEYSLINVIFKNVCLILKRVNY